MYFVVRFRNIIRKVLTSVVELTEVDVNYALLGDLCKLWIRLRKMCFLFHQFDDDLNLVTSHVISQAMHRAKMETAVLVLALRDSDGLDGVEVDSEEFNLFPLVQAVTHLVWLSITLTE